LHRILRIGRILNLIIPVQNLLEMAGEEGIYCWGSAGGLAGSDLGVIWEKFGEREAVLIYAMGDVERAELMKRKVFLHLIIRIILIF